MQGTRRHSLPDAQRADVHAQLAALERAGVPVAQAVGLLRPPGDGGRVADTLKAINQGENLAVAGGRAGLFTAFESTILQAALQAGSPALAHERLAASAAAQARRVAQMRARLAMPLFVFAVALFVQPLPAFIAGSLSGGAYLFGTVGTLLGLGLAWELLRRMARRYAGGGDGPARALIEPIVLRLPVIGDLLVRTEAQRFFENLALLLGSGVTMFDALPLAAGTVSVLTLRRQFERLLPLVQSGATLATAVRGLDCLGNSAVIGMVATGEGSGRLPELLSHYARGEGIEVASRQEQLATWLPRIVYALIALWMAYGLIAGAGAVIGPRDIE